MALGALLGALPAHAIVIPPAPVSLTGPAVPANGVLLFAQDSESLSVTVTLDGSAVEGALEAAAPRYTVWRPTDPFEIGEQYDVETFASTSTIAPIEIIAAYEPAAHELEFPLTLTETWVDGGELACCEPTSNVLEDACFETESVEGRTLRWQVESPLPPEHVNQYLYRYTELPDFTCPRRHICFEPSQEYADYEAFRTVLVAPSTVVPAAEYCITIEARSLIDDQVFTTRRCVEDPDTELGRRPRDEPSGYLHPNICAVPPPGFEEAYCVVAEPTCSHEARALSTPELRAARDEQCASYDALCVDAPPTEDDSSCSASGRAPSPLAWLSALSALSLLGVRRRQRADT